MKKGVFIPLLLGLIFVFNTAFAASPQAVFSYAEFFVPGKGPYIETYLSLIGSSFEPKTIAGKKHAEAEITLVFRQGEKVASFSKYSVKSPTVPDSLPLPNFIDQQRFMLPQGEYILDITLGDVNSEAARFSHQEIIQVGKVTDAICFSDFQFIESYAPTVNQNILSKSGFDLVPYVAHFFPRSMQKLTFYGELYNSEPAFGKGEKFLVSYFIENTETGKMVRDFSSFSRKEAGPVVIVFGEFPIAGLPSGNYNLVVEARDKDNNLIAIRKRFFQRSNPAAISDAALADIDLTQTFAESIPDDSLNYYLLSLYPIASPAEQTYANNQIKSEDNKLKRQFLYRFFMERNPTDPGQAWLSYRQKIYETNEAYGTRNKAGFETDRGMIMLRYGPPNTVTSRPSEPNSYPYEIWHYYKIGNFSNRRFIFYNRDLVSRDYELLHSDMFGELNNPRWQFMLQQRNTPNLDIYDDKGREGFGTDSEDLFNNPR